MRATRTEHTDVGCSEHLKLLSDELKFSECIRIAVRTFRQNACEGQCLLRAVRLDRDIVFLFDGRSRRLNDQFTPSPSPPKPYTVSTPNKACPEPPHANVQTQKRSPASSQDNPERLGHRRVRCIFKISTTESIVTDGSARALVSRRETAVSRETAPKFKIFKRESSPRLAALIRVPCRRRRRRPP